MHIYKITHKLSGMTYVGQTKDIQKRWAYHSKAYSHNNCRYLKNAIQKYGKEHFSFEIIGAYNLKEDLDNAEEYFISYYNCLAPNGYNLMTGGSHKVSALSEESRRLLSESQKKAIREGRNSGIFKAGLRYSPDTEIKGGQRLSPKTEFKKGQKPWNTGLKFHYEQIDGNKVRVYEK